MASFVYKRGESPAVHGPDTCSLISVSRRWVRDTSVPLLGQRIVNLQYSFRRKERVQFDKVRP
jgi:hypothetical protein